MRNRTGNMAMFHAEEDILNNDPVHSKEIYDLLQDYDLMKGVETNTNFSHDQMSLALCWLKKFDPEHIKWFPLFGHHSLRPTNFLFYLQAKYPIFKYLSLLIIAPVMIIGAMRPYKTLDNGTKELKTSGRIIDYFKCEVFGFKITKRIIEFIMSKNDLIAYWKMFTVYHAVDNPQILRAFKEYEIRKQNGNSARS